MSQMFHIDKTVHGSFLIEEGTVRQIAKSLENAHGKPPQISISFENDRTIKSDSIDDLLSDSLINSTIIKQIRLRCYDTDRSTTIVIRNYSYSPISIDIEGKRDWAVSLEDKINNIVPKKSIFSIMKEYTPSRKRLNNAWFSLSLLTGIFFGISVQLENMLAARILLGAIVFIALATALWAAIGSFVAVVTFNFGAGQKRYSARANVAKFLGGGILLTLVIGVSTNYLSKLAGI